MPSAAEVNRLHDGWTALCAAACEGNIETTKALLARGADPNIANSEGLRPLYYAVLGWSPRLLRLLLRHGAEPGCVRGPAGEDLALCVRNGLGAGDMQYYDYIVLL